MTGTKIIVVYVVYFWVCFCLTLGVFGLLRAQNVSKPPEIVLQPMEQGNTTGFIMTTNAAEGDEAIIQICYWIDFPISQTSQSSKIVRCRDTVVPVVNGIDVAIDSVPAPLSEIMRVRVRIVRDVYEKSFPYKETR
jgi:hypothetical protein